MSPKNVIGCTPTHMPVETIDFRSNDGHINHYIPPTLCRLRESCRLTQANRRLVQHGRSHEDQRQHRRSRTGQLRRQRPEHQGTLCTARNDARHQAGAAEEVPHARPRRVRCGERRQIGADVQRCGARLHVRPSGAELQIRNDARYFSTFGWVVGSTHWEYVRGLGFLSMQRIGIGYVRSDYENRSQCNWFLVVFVDTFIYILYLCITCDNNLRVYCCACVVFLLSKLNPVAPGTYSPKPVITKSAPKYSFGVKTHKKISNSTPGKSLLWPQNVALGVVC